MINIPFQERRCPSMRMSETTKEQNIVSRVHPSPSCSQGTIDDEWTSFVLHVLLHSSSTVQSKPVQTQGHPGSHSIFLRVLVPRSQLVLEQTCNVRTILSFLFRWQKSSLLPSSLSVITTMFSRHESIVIQAPYHFH